MNNRDNIKQNNEDELSSRSDFLLRASAEAVNALLAHADSRAGIAQALNIIGRAADVDRVYIFENHADPKTGAILTSQRYEWVRAGITSQIANPAMQNLDYAPIFKRWYDTLSAGKAISGLVRDFPDAERRPLEEQEIISILAVPITINERFWGFIGLDDCRRERPWTAAETSILNTVAANICYALLQRRTEQELRELNEKFALFLKHCPIAFFIKDATTRVILLSDNFEKILGKPMAQLLGKTNKEIWPAATAAEMARDDEFVLQQKKIIEKEEIFGGRQYHAVKFPLATKDNQPLIGGYKVDITEFKKNEETLKRFQAAMDGTGDAIGMADMQGRHFYQNKAFTNLFGYTIEEFNKAGGPLVSFRDPAVHKEVFKTILAGGSWHGELEMLHRSGRIIPMILHADAIKGDDEKPFAVIGIHTDITRRKEIEKALQESEFRYRRLIEASTDYIYTVKIEKGRAVSTQHGAGCITVTGYSSRDYEMDPNLWFKMIHADDRQAVLDQAQYVLKGTMILPIEHRIIHKNGSIRWVRNTPVLHYDTSGTLVSYDGLISDITERKNAEEQIKKHARKLEIINRIITAVNRTDNLEMLLNESLKASLEMVAFAAGGIYLVTAGQSVAELICHQGGANDLFKKTTVIQLTATNYRMLFIEGKPIFTNDASITPSEQNDKWHIRSVAKVPLISKDKIVGALVLIHDRAHIFNEEDQELLLAIGRQIGTAIAKMRSENALRESERKYRTITEQSLVGIQIIKDGLMIFVNDGWTRITGYSAAEVQSWSFEEYLKIVHPKDRLLFAEQARKKQLGTLEDVLPIYDCRFLSKTGATKWISIHSQSVEFSDGRAIVGMIVDITDRKLAEDKIRIHSEIIRNMTGAVYLVRTDNGAIVYTNPEFEKMFGYAPGEMIGKHVSIVNAPTAKTPEEIAGEIAAILNKTGEWHGEVLNIKKDGTRFWCHANVSLFEHPEHGKVFIAVHNDITERKLAAGALADANKQLTTAIEHLSRREQELLKANHDKEILLKEIHHRVKNNLQVINSLINLQIHNITDRNAVGLLKECQSRIKTIAMVHEKMYQLGDLARVDFGAYLESLTRHISHMYQAAPLVALKFHVKDIHLPIDQAIPCALLANELVSNSLKHAFPARKTGEINLEMRADETGNYVFTIGDNGIGLPRGIDYRNTKSLGMQLVTTFVEQLGGAIELENKPGTTFKISFAGSAKEN